MVKRWLGVLLGVFGLLLGLTGCVGQEADLTGEWVYENPAGPGSARISIEDDGAFEITGWPSNLQTSEIDRSLEEEDLNWDQPMSFLGKLDDTTANRTGGGVFFSTRHESLQGYIFDACKYLVFSCDTELLFYLGSKNDEYNYVSFVRRTD